MKFPIQLFQSEGSPLEKHWIAVGLFDAVLVSAVQHNLILLGILDTDAQEKILGNERCP